MGGDFAERISALQEVVGTGDLVGKVEVDQVYRPRPTPIFNMSVWI